MLSKILCGLFGCKWQVQTDDLVRGHIVAEEFCLRCHKQRQTVLNIKTGQYVNNLPPQEPKTLTKTSGCNAINHPNIAPSWACCQCKTMNGDVRDKCKYCAHSRCGTLPAIKIIPYYKDDKVVLQSVKVPSNNKKNLN